MDFNDYEECLQESRMREIRTFGLTRGSNGIGASRPLLSTLLPFVVPVSESRAQIYPARCSNQPINKTCGVEISGKASAAFHDRVVSRRLSNSV